MNIGRLELNKFAWWGEYFLNCYLNCRDIFSDDKICAPVYFKLGAVGCMPVKLKKLLKNYIIKKFSILLIKWICYSGTLSSHPAQQTKIVGQCASHHRSQCKSGVTQTLSLISEVQGGSRIFFPVNNLISCFRIRINLTGTYLIQDSRHSSFPSFQSPQASLVTQW